MKRYSSIEEMAKAQGRHAEAYQFVLEGLQHSVKHFNTKDRRRRHVKAEQLLEGLSEYATKKFGMLASTVFEEWGIKSNEDICQMVYEMIDLGIMRRSREDRPEDFLTGPDIYHQLQECANRVFLAEFSEFDNSE